MVAADTLAALAAGRLADKAVIAALVTAVALLLPSVPGAFNFDVRQSTLSRTVCVPGWAASIRPPEHYTASVKDELLTSRRLPGTVSDYQLDHLVSLSLGGSPTSRLNLWMQPARQAKRDDRLESTLHRELCASRFTLREARGLEISWKRVYG